MMEPYRVCIVGCGSIGLHLASRLSLAKHVILSAVARGETLSALRGGARVQALDGSCLNAFKFVHLSDEPAEISNQSLDAVLVAVKSNQLASVVDTLAALLERTDPTLPVFFAINGIPWYYFYRHGGPRDNDRLQLLDPSGQLWERVGPQRAVHLVCMTACNVTSPGVVKINSAHNLFTISEPSGDMTAARSLRMMEALRAGGADAQISDNMKKEVWVKLLGNICFNPTSVLTDGTVAEMAAHALLRNSVLKPVLREAIAVAEALGVDTKEFPGADERLERVKANKHPPSMLQDFRADRQLETASILEQVQAFGVELDVATPTLNVLIALVKSASGFRLERLENQIPIDETPCKKQRR